MKVYVDNIIFSLQKHGGISTYFESLYKNFPEEVDLILNSELDLPKFMVKLLLLKKINHSQSKNSIFHSSYYRILANPTIPSVMTVHDLFPEQKSRYNLQALLKYRCLNSTNGLIFPSNFTRQIFEKIYPRYVNLPYEIIHHGLSINKNIKIVDGIPEDFILFLGGGAPYKNYEYAKNIAMELGISLVSTGYIEKEINPDVYFLGSIKREQINYLYTRAKMLIFPSDHEGFGFPIIEAQSYGCPVLAFGGGSIPEVLGKDYPLSYEHNNKNYLKAAKRLIKSTQLNNEMIEQGLQNSKQFSWNKSKKQHLKFYGELINDFGRR